MKRLWKGPCACLLLVLYALVLGIWWAWAGLDGLLPSLDRDVWCITAAGRELVMSLSGQDGGDCLVWTDRAGTALGCTLPDGGTFQDAQVLGNTAYALRTIERPGKRVQTLCAVPLTGAVLHPRTLLELPEPGAGVAWDTVCPEQDGETVTVTVSGVDRDGQGWLTRWDAGTGQQSAEPVLEGEQVYALGYVRSGRYAWIGRDGQAGQEVDGARQRDVPAGLAETPCRVSVLDGRCFLSDSLSGDICEVGEDGSAWVWRKGEEVIGPSGYACRQLEVFDPCDGGTGIVGVCAAPDGQGSTAVGEDFAFSRLNTWGLQWRLLWSSAWRRAVFIGAVLAVLAALGALIFRAHRLAVRFSACEALTALVLMAALILVQLSACQRDMDEDAREQLRLLGGSLASALSVQDEMDAETLGETAKAAKLRLMEGTGAVWEDCAVGVYWMDPAGVRVAYDQDAPAGYPAEDVKSRDFLRKLSGEDGTALVRSGPEQYLYVESFTQGERQGRVAVSRTRLSAMADPDGFWRGLLTLSAVSAAFLALVLMTLRLLRPLDDIRQSVEVFRDEGAGVTIPTRRMPHTELYDTAAAFNELSVEARTQSNELSEIQDKYARLVPDALLRMLEKDSVEELSPGACGKVRGAVLLVLPRKAPENAGELQALAEPAAQQVSAHRGLLTGRDERSGALTALFSSHEAARGCARDYLTGGGEAMAAVLTGTAEVGVFGCDTLLCTLADAPRLARRTQAAELLMSFGAVLAESGENASPASPRLLGWDEGETYYEDVSFRDSQWQTCWQDAAPVWERAMADFQARNFPGAMRGFARVLRILPGTDGAARFYVFRCDSLRGRRERAGDTWLLFDGREENGAEPTF